MGEYVLYGGGPSRSMLTEMVLLEGGLAYRLEEIDIFQGKNWEADFLAINPFGWVPALKTPDGEVISETPAINLWLCETHGMDLVPDIADPTRGAFLTAYHNVIGEIEPTLKRIFFAHRYALQPDQTAATRELAQQMLNERLAPVNDWLDMRGPWFLGGRFSLADLTLAYWMTYVERWGGLVSYPAIQKALDLTRDRAVLHPILQRQSDWTDKLLAKR